MKNLNALVLLFTFLMAFSGCEKDNDPPSKADLIVGKNWLVTNNFYSENNGFAIDLYTTPFVGACSKDDIYKFSGDGKYMIDEGPSKCDQGHSQIYQEGTWTISNDVFSWKYAVSGGHFTETYTIEELTSTQMVLDRTFIVQGVTYTFKMTLVAQ